jgi:hypothetical protein
MKDLSNIIGKEYESPHTCDVYYFSELFDGDFPEGYSIDSFGSPFATDACGNLFTTKDESTIYFWDHETDEAYLIAASFEELLAGVTEPASVELREDQVKSVWIDPEFAKQFGIDVPADGWKKKEEV